MTKLIVGNWSVSNIDELRENYKCQTVFFSFAVGELLQWLKDSGYSDEAKAVETLYKQDNFPRTNFETKRIRLYQILNNTDKVPFYTYNDWKILKNIDECRLQAWYYDILWYFKSGNLAIWLRQNGYEAEAKVVESLPQNEYSLKFDEEFQLKTYRQIHKILHHLDDLAFIFNTDPLENIKELRKCYKFSKIFIYFKNGELVKWLEKNGYSDEAKAIASLPIDLDECKIHLSLYKILNFKDSTPQWFDEWSKAFEKYFELCGEIDELLDDAISKYCDLDGDYKENEDEKYERESVYDDIERKNDEINEVKSEIVEICGDTELMEYKLDLSDFKFDAWWQYKYSPPDESSYWTTTHLAILKKRGANNRKC